MLRRVNDAVATTNSGLGKLTRSDTLSIGIGCRTGGGAARR